MLGRKSRNLDQFPDGLDQPPPCQVALQVGLLRVRKHHLCLALIQGFSGLVDTRSAFFMFRFIKRDGHQARLFHQLTRIVHFHAIYRIGVGVGIKVECRGGRFRTGYRHPRHRSFSWLWCSSFYPWAWTWGPPGDGCPLRFHSQTQSWDRNTQ